MLLEALLEAWLRDKLDLYQRVPALLQRVFVDGQHLGTPSRLGSGTLVDDTKRWIPQSHLGGTLLLDDTAFPIRDNDRSSLLVDDDLSPFWTSPPPRYTILSPDTARLQTWLTTNKLPIVVSTFAQIPDQFPVITLRLEQDAQGEVYIGEQVLPPTITATGVEVQLNMERVNGRYLFGIWTQDRDSALWLYAVLRNMVLGSLQEFASWGLSDISMHGLDCDPVLGFVPQYPHTRHFALTVSRFEQAINLAQLEAIDSTRIHAFLSYAPLHIRLG